MRASATTIILGGILLLCGGLMATAQRRVNPVKSANQGLTGINENLQVADSLARAGLKEMTDDTGRVFFVDTITGTEVTDSTNLFPAGSIPKMIYPLWHSASISVDLWDPVMRLFGQHYGLTEIAAEINIHNRYIPVVEVGVGMADYTPENNNYTYRVKPTPYFRIGANYNFFYNSDPRYLAFAGLRFGWSPFNFSIDDVKMTSSYWDETTIFNLPTQHCNVTYLQALFGLRVRIAGPVSLGWAMRFRFKFHETKLPYGQPWYIPGYGTSSGSLTASFSITYTLPLSRLAAGEHKHQH